MSRYNKLWVAMVMAIMSFVTSYTGVSFGFTEQDATALVGLIGTWLVWAVPNGK